MAVILRERLKIRRKGRRRKRKFSKKQWMDRNKQLLQNRVAMLK